MKKTQVKTKVKAKTKTLPKSMFTDMMRSYIPDKEMGTFAKIMRIAKRKS